MFACRQFLPETILHFKCVITKSDCTIRYSSVGELLCVHILNKAFRVLKKKKKRVLVFILLYMMVHMFLPGDGVITEAL